MQAVLEVLGCVANVLSNTQSSVHAPACVWCTAAMHGASAMCCTKLISRFAISLFQHHQCIDIINIVNTATVVQGQDLLTSVEKASFNAPGNA